MTPRKKGRGRRLEQPRQRERKSSIKASDISPVLAVGPAELGSSAGSVDIIPDGDSGLVGALPESNSRSVSVADNRLPIAREPLALDTGELREVSLSKNSVTPLLGSSPRAPVVTETLAIAADVESATAAPYAPTPVSPTTLALLPSTRARAEQIVQDHTALAAGGGLIPVPGLDLAAIGGLQLRLLSALATHYQVAFTRSQAQLIVTSLLGSLGTTIVVGAVLISFAKALPVFGSLLGAASLPLAGSAVTRAIGNLAIEHFEAGGTMENFDLDLAQRAFVQKVQSSKIALA